jgi:hypothetical protein
MELNPQAADNQWSPIPGFRLATDLSDLLSSLAEPIHCSVENILNMRSLIFSTFLVLCCSIAQGSLYTYPDDKRPSMSLQEACTIGDKILGKLNLEKGFYIYGVAIYGDEGQTGAGAWTLYYRNAQGDKIQLGIYFPEDLCIVMLSPKVGEYSEKGYTRDGQVSPKWIESQAQIIKDPFVPADAKK